MEETDPLMAAWIACSDQGKGVGWDSLPALKRLLVLAVDFYFQVSTHGVDGFYSNSTGNRAVESVWALEQLGASQAATILRQCNAAFPGGFPTTSQPDRHQLAVKLANSGTFPAVALDPDAPEWNEVYRQLQEFFERNRDYFGD
jgi:hypothetical protein